MNRYRILWADDEIDLLKPYILFLDGKGYSVTAVNNGRDAVEAVRNEAFDLVILDENMPGLTGLETLSLVKQENADLPVIMITKSEEEDIMDQAVGSKIADYLIKPVNPNQILLSIKKNLHASQLVSEQTSSGYLREFAGIASEISGCATFDDWKVLYRKLMQWDLQLNDSDSDMIEMLATQQNDADAEFFRFVKRNYESWAGDGRSEDAPLISPGLFRERVFPLLDSGEKVFFILIDNFRFDQWLAVKPLLTDLFDIEEDMYCSILPTTTQYARNSIFSGLMPLQIEKMFPELWIDEDSMEGKNVNEAPLIASQLERFRRRYRFSYHKINDSESGEKLLRDFSNLGANDLNVLVLNFIDMLSHARTESKMIRELASNSAAYRSITRSWFQHSSAMDIFRRIASAGGRVVLTTDHGSVRVWNPVKVAGDRTTTTSLRYKVGKNIDYNPRSVYEIRHPATFGLPSPNVSSTYIFAGNDDFFVYPNNYNHYVQYYTDTFQHGGISMGEMLVPLIDMISKQ